MVQQTTTPSYHPPTPAMPKSCDTVVPPGVSLAGDDGSSLTGALEDAIASSRRTDNALIMLQIDERSDEAETLIPQLREILRGTDRIDALTRGRYVLLVHNQDMAQISRKIAAIDFLRAQSCGQFGDRPDGPARIGTTFLRPEDTVERALGRAQTKLDRFSAA